MLLYLHFLPAAFFVMRACARPAVFRLVTQGVVILVVCIGLDAFAHLIWQRNLLGYPYDGRVLKGVFHPKQRLGLFLAVFAPLAIEIVRHWSREFPRLWLLYLPFAIVLLMSLKRSAWLMLAVGLPPTRHCAGNGVRPAAPPDGFCLVVVDGGHGRRSRTQSGAAQSARHRRRPGQRRYRDFRPGEFLPPDTVAHGLRYVPGALAQRCRPAGLPLRLCRFCRRR